MTADSFPVLIYQLAVQHHDGAILSMPRASHRRTERVRHNPDYSLDIRVSKLLYVRS